MRRVLWLFLLATAFGQNIRYDGIAIGPKGVIAGALVAVCQQPASTISAPCTPLANLCTSLSDPTCNSPNPVSADALGNYHFYVEVGEAPFTVQIFGPQVASPFVMTDQSGGGGPGGGTTLETNGVLNTSQALLNIINGPATTVTNPSGGNVAIGIAVGSPNNAVNYSCSGVLCGDSSFLFNPVTKVVTMGGLALSNALYMSTACGAATPPAVTALTTVFAVGADCNPYWSNNGGTMTLMNSAGGGVTGSGTAGKIPVWTSGTAIGNSDITDSSGGIFATGLTSALAFSMSAVPSGTCASVGTFPNVGLNSGCSAIRGQINGGASATGTLIGGLFQAATGSANAAFSIGSVSIANPGTNATQAVGGYGECVITVGITLTNCRGAFGFALNAAVATLANNEGLVTQAGTSGQVNTNNYGLHVLIPFFSGGGTLTHNYGILVEDQASTTGGGTNSDPHAIVTLGTAPSSLGGSLALNGQTNTFQSGAGAPAGSCATGSLYTNSSAASASTVLYVCAPANTWTAVTVP